MIAASQTSLPALILLLGHTSHSYPFGAPTSACQTLLPAHNGRSPSTDPSPYTLVVEGGDNEARLSLQGSKFRGFMVQTRAAGTDTIVEGTFSDYG